MKAFIDRIEGDHAVIHIEDDPAQLDIPLRLLPEGSREGSWLTISFELDPEGTRKQEEKILNLLEKLKRKR
jgi:hypothetical protein